MAKKKIRCTFCAKEEKDVQKLFFRDDKTTEISICDECVLYSLMIIQEKDNTENKPTPPRPIDYTNLTPIKIKAYLDEHIVGQDRAKVTMAVAIYNHYKRLHHEAHATNEDLVLTKGNILMAGPTGSGKTLIASSIAKLLNVPFVVADATTLTEAGYVGEDVENIIKNLWIAADRNVEHTQKGIVCVDEIDKLATRSGSSSSGRDVGGEGVQQALLKMIESGTVQISSDQNKNRPQADLIHINTQNILFIFTGAFSSLSQLVKSRVGQANIGFLGAEEQNKKSTKDHLQGVEAQDFIKFGLIPEFMGRIPIIVTLDDLDEEDLLQILWKPKNSVLRQYQALFALDKVDLIITEDGQKAIVKEAIRRKSGARGLRSIIEDVMLDIMYELPSLKNVKKLIIDEEAISKTAKPTLIYYQDAS